MLTHLLRGSPTRIGNCSGFYSTLLLVIPCQHPKDLEGSGLYVHLVGLTRRQKGPKDKLSRPLGATYAEALMLGTKSGAWHVTSWTNLKPSLARIPDLLKGALAVWGAL